MKISSIDISNFRGISWASFPNLRSIVVIAGENGTGKSCIFDAIRLIKSVYGGYQPFEYQQWFSEFQIKDIGDTEALLRIFHNQKEALRLRMEVSISDTERKYLRENAEKLMLSAAWDAAVPDRRRRGDPSFASQYRQLEPDVRARASESMAQFTSELDQLIFVGEFIVEPRAAPQVAQSRVLEALFVSYAPGQLGLIDFHGPHRLFVREQFSNINVDLNSVEEQQKNSSLYNYNNKYKNVKSELAGLYVREMIARDAGVDFDKNNSTAAALKDLFLSFFPSKEFLGPKSSIDGSLTFSVRVGDDKFHDLDELSAGEKEILYGYLRLRNSAPKGSVILIDEPELHLNPKLTRALPGFYFRNLVETHDNQMFFVTHSDAMLRESVGHPEFSVFRMSSSASTGPAEFQARLIEADQDIVSAVLELVGDLSGYSPGARIVVFEGAEDFEFDIRLTSELFPDFASRVNCIPGTNKTRVRGLYALLAKLEERGKLPFGVYSITDADSGELPRNAPNEREWDCYHIENYLLEPRFVAAVVEELRGPGARVTEEDAERMLFEAAARSLPALVVHRATGEVNARCVGALSIGAAPNTAAISSDLKGAVDSSISRLVAAQAEGLSLASITTIVEGFRQKYEQALADGSWKKSFRGRDILKDVVGSTQTGANYSTFRNLLAARMREAHFEPVGMRSVLVSILPSLR